jgi:lipoprotein-anchoring transpeptidase ErfK/SrfK
MPLSTSLDCAPSPPHPISRRDFLKAGSLWLAGLALSPSIAAHLPPEDRDPPAPPPMLGRVTRLAVPVYADPDLDSPRVSKLDRDVLVALQEIILSPHGPVHNPRWYRVDGGYLHSAYVQRVDTAHENTPLQAMPTGGLLGEVTVPFTQTQYQDRNGYWMPLYRLYYGSIHWITGLDEDASGELCYRLTDEWLRIHYWAPAKLIRPLGAAELDPLSPDCPPEEKRLVVSLEQQTLVAYEGDALVRHCTVSTGKKYMETPAGEFKVDRKYPSKHMGDGAITSKLNAYELVGVPWVSFFHKAGIAFHGTFWHDNFGAPMSHGCINLRIADACWLFRWTLPAYAMQSDVVPTWKITAKEGTGVIVA